MTWDYKTKEKIQYCFAGALCVFGMILVAISAFVIEPLGAVDATIITIFGFCLSFAGAVFGLNMHYNNELQNFKAEVMKSVNNNTNSEENVKA